MVALRCLRGKEELSTEVVFARGTTSYRRSEVFSLIHGERLDGGAVFISIVQARLALDNGISTGCRALSCR